MELYEELARYFMWRANDCNPINLKSFFEDVVRAMGYRMLRDIRDIVRDPSLDDPECFDKIEQIICVFEKYGVDAGFRHDYG